MNSSTVRNLESDLQEVGGHKVYNTPEADVVMFVVEALRHEENLSPELQRMKVMLEATAVMLRGRQTASQAASTRTQHATSRGPNTGRPGNDNQNRGGAGHPQGSRHEGDLRDVLNNRDLRERLNGRHRDRAEFSRRNDESVDGFPCFSSRLNALAYLQQFKPASIDKYDGTRLVRFLAGPAPFTGAIFLSPGKINMMLLGEIKVCGSSGTVL